MVKPKSDCLLVSALIDPDVLNCHICSEPLSIPVFQCKSGHIICFSCCSKLSSNCPNCNTQTEFTRCRPIEKVLESLKIPCKNTPYGCKEILLFGRKCLHEKMCEYLPCSCPVGICDFLGSSTDLATHFRDHQCKYYFSHDALCRFFMKLSQEYLFFQEKEEGTIFIVRNKSQPNGNAFSVSCIGPCQLKDVISYDLVAKYPSDKGSCLRLQSTTDIVQGLPTGEPEKLINYLIVPSDWSCGSDVITFELWIWKNLTKPDIMGI